MEHKLDDETLMRWLDGDLPRDEAREAERMVAASPELRMKADSLAQLREVMTAHYGAAADEADAKLEGLWGKIEPEVRSAPARAPSPPRRTWLEGVREWLETYRSHLITGGLAAAAGALLTLAVSGSREKVVYVREAPPVRTAVATAAEVESLEVMDGSAAVLQIPGDRDDEAATTVIWITPNSPDEGPI